jgi:hypothetical protein
MALMLHEVRAMIRKAEKGELEPERLLVSNDGHFVLHLDQFGSLRGYARVSETGRLRRRRAHREATEKWRR